MLSRASWEELPMLACVVAYEKGGGSPKGPKQVNFVYFLDDTSFS
jgi:hypothetical protein